MRSFTKLLVVSMLFCLAPIVGHAAEPTVELRVQSVNQLLPTVEYLSSTFNQAEAGKQIVAFLKTVTDEKTGIDGIDPTKPVGFSLTLLKDVADSPTFLMIPVADQATMLEALETKLMVEATKGTDGHFTLKVPNVEFPIFVRFTQGYAIITPLSAKNLSDATIVDTKTFFAAKLDTSAKLQIHLDHVPDEVRDFILPQLELKLQDELQKKPDGESAGQEKLRLWLGARIADVAPMVLKQGQEVTWALNIDPTTDTTTSDISFQAKPGTLLAKVLRAWQGRSGQPSVVLPGETTALTLQAKAALPPEAVESFEPVVEGLLKDIVDSTKESDRGFVSVALDAIKPTLRAGELDFNAALLAGTDGKPGAFAFSMKLVKGQEIEKIVKLFGPFIPAKDANVILNAETVEGVSLHKIQVNAPTRMKALFGTNIVWLSIQSDRLLLTIETNGERHKTLLSAKPNNDALPLNFSFSASRVATYLDSAATTELITQLRTDVLGKAANADADKVTMSIQGGDEMRFVITTKGKAVTFLTLLQAELKP